MAAKIAIGSKAAQTRILMRHAHLTRGAVQGNLERACDEARSALRRLIELSRPCVRGAECPAPTARLLGAEGRRRENAHPAAAARRPRRSALLGEGRRRHGTATAARTAAWAGEVKGQGRTA